MPFPIWGVEGQPGQPAGRIVGEGQEDSGDGSSLWADSRDSLPLWDLSRHSQREWLLYL